MAKTAINLFKRISLMVKDPNTAEVGMEKKTYPAYFVTYNAASLPSFSDYLFKNRRNKWYLGTAAIAIVLQFTVFKYFYPQAGFINGDSYVYLETAKSNLDINIYLAGYSKFLRIFSTFTTSDTALVAFQYLLLQCSGLYFLFTLFYFYRPGKTVQTILLGFFVLNPIFLYLSNYIMSDSLFYSLSLIWFTLLIRILHHFTARLIVIQALVLFLAFTVRYNSLYYPLVLALALLLSRQRIWAKLAGFGGSMILLAGFVLFTSSKYYELAGVREYAPFIGWQTANNALYAYRYVDDKDVKPAPARFRGLDKVVRTYFDTTRDLQKHPEEGLIANTVYMWDYESPLYKYMNLQFRRSDSAGRLKKWAAMAPLYGDYGRWLIRQYPVYFAEYYLLPNALRYYTPPVEFLSTYNMGIDTVDEIAQKWFGYKSIKVKPRVKDFSVSTLDFYPILVGIVNAMFLVSLLFFLILKGFRTIPALKRTLLLVTGLWLVNGVFSVFASPIALRFQMFPVFVFMSMTLILMELVWKMVAFSELNKPAMDKNLAL